MSNVAKVFRERVRARLEELNLRQADLARRTKSSPGFVSRVLAAEDDRVPSIRDLDLWAKALKLEPWQLFTKDTPEKTDSRAETHLQVVGAGEVLSRITERYVAVPIIAGRIAASVSGSADLEGDEIDDWAIIYRDWAPDWKNFCCVRVAENESGESMLPTIRPGYIVGIDYSHPSSLKKFNGKIVAANVGDRPDPHFALKRAWVELPRQTKKTKTTGRITLTSDAAAIHPDLYPPLCFEGEEAEGRIIGLVRWWWGCQE